jgi:hypothetical protein
MLTLTYTTVFSRSVKDKGIENQTFYDKYMSNVMRLASEVVQKSTSTADVWHIVRTGSRVTWVPPELTFLFLLPMLKVKGKAVPVLD